MRPTRTAALAATLLIAAGVSAGHVSAQPSSEGPAAPPAGPEDHHRRRRHICGRFRDRAGQLLVGRADGRRGGVLLEADERRRARRQFAHQEAGGGADLRGRHRVHDQRLPAVAIDQRPAAQTRQPDGDCSVSSASSSGQHSRRAAGAARDQLYQPRPRRAEVPEAEAPTEHLAPSGCSARPLTA